MIVALLSGPQKEDHHGMEQSPQAIDNVKNRL